MLKKLLFSGEWGLSPQANVGLTVLRIFCGISLMLAHGMGKLPPSEQFVAGTANMGFPIPTGFAWAAAMSEFLGGAFLALGLFTRIAALFICFTMTTALVGVHYHDPFAKKELAAMYLAVAGAFLIMGANDWSVDKAIK